MGNCYKIDSTTREVDKKMQEEQQKEEKTSKILFLGTGGGGKSTMFKQLGYIYNGSNAKMDPLVKTKIYTQIIEQMQTAIENLNIETNINNTKMSDCITTIQNHTQLTKLPIDVANAIQYIWRNNETLQSLMINMSFTQKIFEETTAYFWNELDRIKEPNYIPNRMDFLNLREKTTGIAQRYFNINNRLFHIFDAGGQVSERKKWINCFDNVTSLLFVVGLSSYNQFMYEDSNKNCMEDSMEIFKRICNNKVFKKSHLILFFNKFDLFQMKIKNMPITECPVFDDFLQCKNNETNQFFNDKCDFEQCKIYIKQKYNRLNRTNKIIYTHFTCALQTENISNVFNDVQNIILMENAKHLVYE